MKNPDSWRTLFSNGKQFFTDWNFAKYTAKTVGVGIAKEVPKVGIAVGTNFVGNKASEYLTGKTAGEHIANLLTDRYGFEVSPEAATWINPFNYYGYKLGNNITNLIYERYSLANIPIASSETVDTYVENLNKKGVLPYKGTPNRDGDVLFKDMTSEQVAAWNMEVAPT